MRLRRSNTASNTTNSAADARFAWQAKKIKEMESGARESVPSSSKAKTEE